jgi:hypothetical protein
MGVHRCGLATRQRMDAHRLQSSRQGFEHMFGFVPRACGCAKIANPEAKIAKMVRERKLATLQACQKKRGIKTLT